MGYKREYIDEELKRLGAEPENIKDLSYQQVSKLLFSITKLKKDIDPVKEVKKVINVKKSPEVPKRIVNNDLFKDLIEFMPTILNKVRGTKEEIKIMFDFYNKVHKTRLSPNCSSCISTVYKNLTRLYHKIK